MRIVYFAVGKRNMPFDVCISLGYHTPKMLLYILFKDLNV